MKKVIFAVLISFAFMASVNAQARDFSLGRVHDFRFFMEVYQQVLKLNANRFANVNQIQIGDSVMFPSTGFGTRFLIADKPSKGVHDCLYRMTGKYVAGQILTRPVEIEWAPVMSTPTRPAKFVDYDSRAFAIFITLCLIVIIAYLLNRFRPWNNRRNINRNPVVTGGLSNNAAEATAQISALIPGSRVVKSERGRLICASPVKVKMNFSDGVKKITLVSGEEYYHITQEDGAVRYARRACGNLVSGSISDLPEGVTFVPSTEENANWMTPAAETEEKKVEDNTGTEEDEPIEVYLHIIEEPSNSEIVELVKAAGEMTNKPTKITYKDLVIDFAPQIEKAKGE